MIIAILFSLLGSLAFLFAFWSRMNEDYTPNQYFSTAFFSLFAGILGYLLAYRFFPIWWFWFSILFAMLGLSLGGLKFKLRLTEVFETFVLGFLYAFSVYFLYAIFFVNRLQSLVSLAICAALVSAYYLMDKHYRKFAWYKSGKIGFTGLSVFGLLFLTRALFAVALPDVISLVGNVDAVVSGGVSFLAFLAVFNLARR